VVVREFTLPTVDDNATYALGFQQCLVNAEIGEVREKFRAFLLAQRFRMDIIGGSDLASRIVRVIGERVWGQHIVRHILHGTAYVAPDNMEYGSHPVHNPHGRLFARDDE